MKDIFRPEDFICKNEFDQSRRKYFNESERIVISNRAKFLFFGWLKENGKKVYTGPSYGSHWIDCETMSTTTQAYLIGVEEIEKCEHPEGRIRKTVFPSFCSTETTVYQCECGAKVEPKIFVEVK